MKFAIRHFKLICKTTKIENIQVLVVLGAILGFVVGIPLMFIGGYKSSDMIIPVVSAAVVAVLPYFLVFITVVLCFLTSFRRYSVLNKYGYCTEYLKIMEKSLKYKRNQTVYNKLSIANILRNIKRFDEAERVFQELSDCEMTEEQKKQYLTLYLILALQMKDYDLYNRVLEENGEFIEEKLKDTNYAFHLILYRECVRGNHMEALAMCERSVEDEHPCVGVNVYAVMAYLYTQIGVHDAAQEAAEKAEESIDEKELTYDFELEDNRKRIKMALAGELVPPFTQAFIEK